MTLPTYAYTFWLLGLLIITFAAGCSVGLGFAARRAPRKAPHARKR